MSAEGDSEIPDFNGKYVLDRSEKFEEFLAANGVNWVIRKMAGSSRPNADVTQDGSKITFRLHSLVIDRSTTFTVGEDFNEVQQNGVEMRVSSSWEGKKLKLVYTPTKEGAAKPQTVIREMDGDEMIMTMQVDDVMAKRVFKKIG